MTDSNISDISQALRQLEELIRSPNVKIGPVLRYPPPRAPEESTSENRLQIEKIQPLQNKALLQYLRQRGIAKQTAAAYVKEIYYCLRLSTYF
jgi:hypothetical protein